MLYIRKTQISKGISDEISRVKREQKSLLDRHDPKSARTAFDCLDKNIIRTVLVSEQHGLCAYCMRRIDHSSTTTIEHWQPIEKNVDGAIDYRNMLGVCDGGRNVDTSVDDRRILCCDASKGNQEITINPCNSEHMRKIRYNEDGKIYTFPRDETLERDINEVLCLNGVGGLDTSTRLIWNRREAYRAFQRFIKENTGKGKISRRAIENRIKYLEDKEVYDEFAGVILYLLKRKLKQFSD